MEREFSPGIHTPARNSSKDTATLPKVQMLQPVHSGGKVAGAGFNQFLPFWH